MIIVLGALGTYWLLPQRHGTIPAVAPTYIGTHLRGAGAPGVAGLDDRARPAAHVDLFLRVQRRGRRRGGAHGHQPKPDL